MKRHIAFLLVLVLMLSTMSAGLGMNAYADDKEDMGDFLNAITTNKPAEKEEAEEPAEEETAQEQPEETKDAELTGEAAEGETEEAEESPEPAAEEAGEDEPFDQLLVGAWYCYSKVYPEKLSDSIRLIEEIGSIDGFFYNGAVNSTKLDYPMFIAEAGEALVITAGDGKMDYFEKLCDFTKKHPELFTEKYTADYIEELKECSNVEITYKFFDLTDKGDGDFKPSQYGYNEELFKKYRNDGLIISVEADVQVGPLERKHLEWEFKFCKDYTDTLDMKKWSLLGEWEDSMGNSWTIAPYIPEEANSSGYKFPECVYVLKDASGKEHITQSVYWSHGTKEDFNINGYIDFNFKTFDTPEFKVISMSHDEVVLKSESGSLTLTRTGEPFATAGEKIPE